MADTHTVRVSVVIKDEKGHNVNFSLQGLNKVDPKDAQGLMDAVTNAARLFIQSTYERTLS